eukprot:CAMPEP_0175442140 /NCGR_PEP_ID=MMETSP0095-20121207/57990_1 /TAXON_ID=311494 /ORGANISM="Alexandrium monilatum, Strain CCMP3105" /LENGTH=52 /DNA_ID=CAMNT_0016742151 /DNA_START=84 /DNA_END=239 /DNA_ORIENTATION=+
MRMSSSASARQGRAACGRPSRECSPASSRSPATRPSKGTGSAARSASRAAAS